MHQFHHLFNRLKAITVLGIPRWIFQRFLLLTALLQVPRFSVVNGCIFVFCSNCFGSFLLLLVASFTHFPLDYLYYIPCVRVSTGSEELKRMAHSKARVTDGKVTYPPGVKEISDKISKEEMVRRLKVSVISLFHLFIRFCLLCRPVCVWVFNMFSNDCECGGGFC